MRLNRFLAKAGIASRRAADLLLVEGRVAVNGQTVTEPGRVIDESSDEVTFDGERLMLPDEYVYLLVNKPSGYLVTCRDEFKRPVVLDLVRGYERLVRPVGRLDLDSSGLLLLTNDGELAFRLSHPRFKIDKKYMVKCEGSISDEKLAILRTGVELEDGRTRPARVELVARKSNVTRLNITMHEGRKRQIRRMCDAVGHRVVSLRRIEYGGIKLGRLKSGSYRHLGKEEIEDLKRAVGI